MVCMQTKSMAASLADLRASYSRVAVVNASLMDSWFADACPVEETRHSCTFLNQPNAGDVARRAADEIGASASAVAERVLHSLDRKEIHFVGDSVMRQLAQSFMCRLRRVAAMESDRAYPFRFIDPTRRRVPSKDYIGMCPLGTRNCEYERGCALFRRPSGRPFPFERRDVLVRVCYWNHAKIDVGGRQVKAGWPLVHKAVMQFGAGAAYMIFHSGHHSNAATLERLWGGTAGPSDAVNSTLMTAARMAAFSRAKATGTRLIFQEFEEQHFPGGGAYDAAKHKGVGGLKQCEQLEAQKELSARGPPRRMIDVERELVHPYVCASGGAILKTNDYSRAAWWGHTYSARTPSGTADCTHWCMPGVPDVWTHMLMSLITRDWSSMSQRGC